MTCTALLLCACSASALSTTSAFDTFSRYIRARQKALVSEIEAVDGEASFSWNERDDGSGGMCVLEGGGAVWEKAGVGVTVTRGVLTESRASAMSSRGRAVEAGASYAAAALSLVMHAASPMVPTFRSDVRLFEVEAADGSRQCWVGGGADLTPSYLFDDDAVDFHRFWKGVCDAHGCADYDRFKTWCDEYFYLPNRGETRGIGGIFFDDLDDPTAVDFAIAVADGFMESCGLHLDH